MISHMDIRDPYGSAVLRYIRLPDGAWFGGNTSDAMRLDAGPHVIHHTRSMLDLLARLANEDDQPYDLVGGLSGGFIRLKPEMDGTEIAGILGIDVKDVQDRYARLVVLSMPQN